jgi:hypothetical protein
MSTGDILDILVTVIFWVLVFYIAWNENATQPWLYVLLLAFLVYFGLQAIFKRQGMERMVWLYSLNMVVLVYLLYYFSRR